jgi:hypothetical protein
MMWSRSRSPPRFRFIGVEPQLERRDPLRAVRAADYACTERSTASGLDWISSVQR